VSESSRVRVGSYALDVGAPAHSFAQFEAARESENSRALAAALARGIGEQRPLEALETFEESAASVADRIERANTLLQQTLEGTLLDRDALRGEVDALLDLLGRLDRAGRYKEELRLARSLYGLLLLWLRWVELVHSLRTTLDAARKAGDEAGQAWALHELGTLQLIAGDPRNGSDALREALRLEHGAGDAAGRCVTQHNLDCAQRDLASRATVEHWPRRLLRLAGLVAVLGILAAGGTEIAMAVGGGHHALGPPPPTDTTLGTSTATTPGTSTAVTTLSTSTTTAHQTTTDPTTTTQSTTTQRSTATTSTTTTAPPDVTEPLVTITSPADAVLPTPSPTFSGAAGTQPTDSPLVELSIESNGSVVNGYPVSLTVTDGHWSYTPTTPLDDGLYDATVLQLDKAGNRGTATASFTIDTIPPTLTLKCPNTTAASVPCTLTASENATVKISVSEIPPKGTETQPQYLTPIPLTANVAHTVTIDLSKVSAYATVHIIATPRDAVGNEPVKPPDALLYPPKIG
jgi:Bacterial Ig-like domain